MRPWWVMLWAACTTEDGGYPPAPPPPIALTSSALYVDHAGRLVVTGAPAGASVALVTSIVGPGGGPCPPSLRGECLDLVAPTLLAVQPTGPTGEARFPFLGAAEGPRWFQAAVLGAPLVSGVVDAPVGPDPDADDDEALDVDELALGLDPARPDHDDDGALDGVELARGLDPHDPDSDHDGRLDGVDLEPLTPSAPDPFTPACTRAVGPWDRVPDAEYHPGLGRAAWQYSDGSALWVAAVDPATGMFVPSDGKGTRVDIGVGPMSVGRNGPEWTDGPAGPHITYIKRRSGAWALWYARWTGAAWVGQAMAGDPQGERPYGQHLPTAAAPRAVYRWFDGAVWRNGWTTTDNAQDGGALPRELSMFNTRWGVGEPDQLVGTTLVDGYHQVFRYDVRSGAWEVLTTDPVDKHDPYLVSMPEWGGEPAIVALTGDGPEAYTGLTVYREAAGTWAAVNSLPTPPAFPHPTSPEVFHWADRTYVSYAAATWTEGPDAGLSHAFVAALDPASPLVRLVTPYAVVGGDAEPYTGGVRPWLYFSIGGAPHRCELGL